MKAELTDQQKAAMQPVVEQIRQLKTAYDQHMAVLVRMAGMVEPRVLDPATGVRLNVDTLTFIYPATENGDGLAR